MTMYVRSTLVEYIHPSIVCLQETKLDVIPQSMVIAMLGVNLRDFAYLPASNTRGGILLAARQPDVAISDVLVGCYSLTVRVRPPTQGDVADHSWWLSVVYGPQEDSDKVLLKNSRQLGTHALGLGQSRGTSTLFCPRRTRTTTGSIEQISGGSDGLSRLWNCKTYTYMDGASPGLSSLEQTIARQRSCIWKLSEGDANTTYFHLIARGRKRRNFIPSLSVQGYTIADHEGMERALFDHFSGVFGTAPARGTTLNFQVLGIQ